jgi:GT2 family glycosyltransferase
MTLLPGERMPASAPEVTIVTPTYNRWSSLQRLLAALERQSCGRDRFEVVVIDDGSTDGTPHALSTLSTPLTLTVLTQAHGGPAKARNLGVAHARGSLILFLDDDVQPVDGLVAAHLEKHAQHGAAAIVIGPMSPPSDWPRPVWIRWEEEKLERQYAAMLAGRFSCTHRQFYTGNSSLSRELFVRVGGFDTTFKRAEDVELGYRLHQHGARFVFAPQADVKHFASRTFAGWCRTPYQYGRYDVVMSRKGYETMDLAMREFRWRHPINRLAARVFAGHGRMLTWAVAPTSVVVRFADKVGALRVASSFLSGIFNLLYWQGVCDELGGRQVFTRIFAGAGAAAR